MIFSIDEAMKHSYSNDDTSFRIDVIDEILEEDFDELLNEFNQLLYYVDETILEDKVLAEYDQFMAMIIEDNNESSDNEEEETTFEKIVFDTEHKVRNSLVEPPPTNVKGIRSFLGHARFYR